MREGCVAETISKGEKERSCLREEIRGHLRVKGTQQRQLERLEKETKLQHKAQVIRKKEHRGKKKDNFLNKAPDIIG